MHRLFPLQVSKQVNVDDKSSANDANANGKNFKTNIFFLQIFCAPYAIVVIYEQKLSL